MAIIKHIVKMQSKHYSSPIVIYLNESLDGWSWDIFDPIHNKLVGETFCAVPIREGQDLCTEVMKAIKEVKKGQTTEKKECSNCIYFGRRSGKCQIYDVIEKESGACCSDYWEPIEKETVSEQPEVHTYHNEDEYLTPGQAIDLVLAGEMVEFKYKGDDDDQWFDLYLEKGKYLSSKYKNNGGFRDKLCHFDNKVFRKVKPKKKWIDCTWWEAAEHKGRIRDRYEGIFTATSQETQDRFISWFRNKAPWQKEVEE